MKYVLSGYPLSKSYREKLEALIASPVQRVSLVELRQAGPIAMIRALRRLSGNALYVAYEDPLSKAILPVLRLAAAVAPIDRQFVVDDELRLLRISRAQMGWIAIELLAASLAGLLICAFSIARSCWFLMKVRVPLAVRGRRVLFLNANLWFGVKAGGSVGHISGVVNAFSNENHDVLFCSAGGRLMVNERTPLLSLVPPKLFGLPWEINYYSFDNSVVEQLIPIGEKFAPSFIYQRMSLGNTSGVRLSRRLGVPLVIEYNGSEVWVARNWGRPLRFEWAATLAEESCLRHAHLIVTVSETLREELLRRGIEGWRIATYPNCVDPEIFDPSNFSAEDILGLRTRYGIEQDATVVAFIGSFGQWHGVPVLARVIRQMIDSESSWLDKHKVRFILIGDGIKMPEVRSILGDHLNSQYVRLTGLVAQETAPLHLAAADVLSSPHVPNDDGSPFFGSPTKLFEYMAMGKAIVASDLNQIGAILNTALRAEELSSGVAANTNALALLSMPGSVDGLATGIRFLVNNPELRQTLGRNARQEALRRYTWAHHVRHILNELHSR